MATKSVCPHTITIFNYIGEDQDGNAKYTAAVLKYVHAHINEGAGAGDVSKDSTRAHIFDSVTECEKTFLSHRVWLALPDEEKVKYWTLCTDGKDYFAFGEAALFGTKLPDDCTLFRINLVARRQIGHRRTWHWRIEGR